MAWGTGTHALCPQWVYKTCWADKCNHRNHLRITQPSICLSSKSWGTDEVVEEAIEETAPCMLVGQRDWTCPVNGRGVAGQEGERGWSKYSAGPSHLLFFCLNSSSPLPLWMVEFSHLLGLGLHGPLLRGLPWLFCPSSSPLHCPVLCQSFLFFLPPLTTVGN